MIKRSRILDNPLKTNSILIILNVTLENNYDQDFNSISNMNIIKIVSNVFQNRLYQFPINWQALIWMWSSTLPINSLIDWHVPSETPILLGSASSKQVYDKHSNRHLDFANRIYLGCKLTNILSTFILLICFKPFFYSSPFPEYRLTFDCSSPTSNAKIPYLRRWMSNIDFRFYQTPPVCILPSLFHSFYSPPTPTHPLFHVTRRDVIIADDTLAQVYISFGIAFARTARLRDCGCVRGFWGFAFPISSYIHKT